MKDVAMVLSLAVLTALLLTAPAAAQGHGGAQPSTLAATKLANFTLLDEPRPVPAVSFVDGEGRPRALDEFRGRVVLLNLWATWCAPCRREMPTLERLQAKLGGADFEVVALSVDRGGVEQVRSFLDELGIRDLAVYVDPTTRAMRALGAIGLPTTLLIDREGRELGRLIGPAEWDSAEALAFIRAAIAAPASPPADTRAAADPKS